MEQKVLHKYYVNSLEGVFSCVEKIEKVYQEKGQTKSLWFRGQEFAHYNLIPNIFRKADYKYNSKKHTVIII